MMAFLGEAFVTTLEGQGLGLRQPRSKEDRFDHPDLAVRRSASRVQRAPALRSHASRLAAASHSSRPSIGSS
jgi:hypothetical protein